MYINVTNKNQTKRILNHTVSTHALKCSMRPEVSILDKSVLHIGQVRKSPLCTLFNQSLFIVSSSCALDLDEESSDLVGACKDVDTVDGIGGTVFGSG